MKKLLILIICLLWITPCHGWMSSVICGGGVAAAPASTAYCTAAATCTATNPGQCDVLCEDFEGSTDCGGAGDDTYCRNAYTVSVGTDCTVNFAATASGTYPCASTTNTRVLNMVSSGTNVSSVIFNAGAGKAINYTQFYFRVNSENLSSGQNTILAQGCTNSSCSAYAWKLSFRDGGLNRYYLDLTYYNGTAFSTISTAQGTVTTTTWYRVNVKHDYTNTAVNLSVNGSAVGEDASDVGNRQPQYFALWGGSQNTTDVEYDNWAVDDDTIQGACAN